jgi:hypothetical protein
MRITATVLLAATLAAAATKPGEEGTPEFGKAAALVKQLGNARFAVREAAAKELVEMGMVAVPALSAGSKSDDEEIRTRSTALIPQAKATEWKRRADAYLARPDAKHDLPLLAEWDKLVGKPDAGKRKLYADMLRSSGEFVERAAAKKSPADTAAQCRRILDRTRSVTGPVKVPVGELAAVVFADTFNPELGHRRHTPIPMDGILANSSWEDALDVADIAPAVRRLLGRWVDLGGPADSLVFQHFADLVRRRPFPEAAPNLIKMASDPKERVFEIRLFAVDALGKVGGKEVKETLTALIEDKTDVFDGTPAGQNQLGDAALAALIQMNGKKISDYGMTNNYKLALGTNTPGKRIPIILYGFHTADDRAKAIEKWKAESVKKDK